MDIGLLEKYKNLEFKPQAMLFDVDLRIAAKEKRCPFCLCKLYKMQTKPFWYCRSKKHKRLFKEGFVIHNDKMTRMF